MARTAVTSTQFRRDATVGQGYSTTSNIAWGGSVPSQVDAYFPAGSNRPVIGIIKGSWCDGTVKTGTDLVAMGRSFAALGFTVFVPNFLVVTGCTGNTATTFRQGIIDDVLSFMTWMRANAATYNGDVTKIALIGHSAGGQLALMAGVQGTASTTRPDAIVGYSPATRLDRTHFAGGQSHAAVGPYIENYLGMAADVPSTSGAAIAQSFSPYNQTLTNLPAIRLVCHATEPDLGIPQSDIDDMHTVAVAASVDSTKRVITGSIHNTYAGADIEGTASWLRDKLRWTPPTAARGSGGTRASAGTRTAA